MKNFTRTLIALALGLTGSAATFAAADVFYIRVAAPAKCAVAHCTMKAAPASTGGAGSPAQPAPAPQPNAEPGVDAAKLAAQARAYVRAQARCQVVLGKTNCSAQGLVAQGILSAYPNTAVGDAWGGQRLDYYSGPLYSFMVTRTVNAQGQEVFGRVNFAGQKDPYEMEADYAEYWSDGSHVPGAYFAATLSGLSASACAAVAALGASDVGCSGGVLSVTTSVHGGGEVGYARGNYAGFNTISWSAGVLSSVSYPQ